MRHRHDHRIKGPPRCTADSLPHQNLRFRNNGQWFVMFNASVLALATTRRAQQGFRLDSNSKG